MRTQKLLLLAIISLLLTLFPVRLVLAQEEATALDLMTFAQGVLPISIDTGEARLRVGMAEAISVIDGNSRGNIVTQKPGIATDVVEITFALPALTRFDRFAIPNVLETPSPSQTFFRNVEISGSATSPDGQYVPLATGELSTHTGPDEVSELVLAADQPEVLWVKVRLWDGINVERDQTYFEFSELIGNGVQRARTMSEQFSGVWKGRGVKIEMAQVGAAVVGCYDGTSKLAGTVEGNILRALGHDAAGVPSQFILIVSQEGALRGLRSANGAPFKLYDGDTSTKEPVCLSPEPPTLGCGATVHGIGFDYDSDIIRPESETIINALFDGLVNDQSAGIQIIGHSSSEGQADYNRNLSQRRAQSVVTALVALGLDPSQISGSGRGEDDPIASNKDEAGRSLNRRVEIKCGG